MMRRLGLGRTLQYIFIALGMLCLLILLYGLLSPAYLPKENFPELPQWESAPRLEPFEWRELDRGDTAGGQEQQQSQVSAWTLQIGEVMSDRATVEALQGRLREEGFRAYIRRYHRAASLQYGLFVGPWLTPERLQQEKTRLETAGVIELSVKAVPYLVHDEFGPR